MAMIDAMPADKVELVVRAFSSYFMLVQRGGRKLCAPATAVACCRTHGAVGRLVRRTLADLKAQGISVNTCRACLTGLHYAPVFTAHPTEARSPCGDGSSAPGVPDLRPALRQTLGVNDQRELETSWLPKFR